MHELLDLSRTICFTGTLEQLIQFDAQHPNVIRWEHVLKACTAKQTDMAIWLLTQCTSSDFPERRRYDGIFYKDRVELGHIAIKTGNLELFQWLHSHFPLNYDWFSVALMQRQFSIARWLKSEYPAINVVSVPYLTYVYSYAIRADGCLGKTKVDYWMLWWLLSHYSAAQFWARDVQRICARAMKRWTGKIYSYRKRFMMHIAPHLPSPQN